MAVYALTEDTVRRAARALVALGGEWNQDVLSLDTEEGPLSVGTADLMLLVRGPIARETRCPQTRAPVGRGSRAWKTATGSTCTAALMPARWS